MSRLWKKELSSMQIKRSKVKLPSCEKCGMEMTIDEWQGWSLWCPFCDIHSRDATPEEHDIYIKEMEEYYQNEIKRKKRRDNESSDKQTKI